MNSLTFGTSPDYWGGLNLYYKACFGTFQSDQNTGVATFQGGNHCTVEPSERGQPLNKGQVVFPKISTLDITSEKRTFSLHPGQGTKDPFPCNVERLHC